MGATLNLQKNNAVISFHEELDLSPFTVGSFFLKYRLLSVVQHRGTKAKGHYITLARAPSGAWMKLDDNNASLATGIDPFCPQDEDDEDGEGPFTPYVLFWAKVDEIEITEPPIEVHKASTNAGDDDELQPVQIPINGVLPPPSKTYFVKKSKLAKPKQQNKKDEDEERLRPLQTSINGIEQPPSEKYSVKKSFSAILNQQDVEEIYKNISKILLASETREKDKRQEMSGGKKNELEKAKSSSVKGEVEESGKKKESPGTKDGKDGKGDEDEEGDKDEKEEQHEGEEGKKEEQQQQQQQQQDEQEQEEQGEQQQQEKHEEKTQTEEKESEKVSSNKQQRPNHHSTSKPANDKFSNRQKSPNNSTSSQYPRKGGDSEQQTSSNGEASKNVEPKRAQVGKKRRKKKKKKKNW